MINKNKTIPVFRPTMEEFTSGFSEYISKIEPICKEFGLGKIIPPEEWNPRKHGWYNNIIKSLTIPAPISQYVSGMKGIFQQTNIIGKPLKISKFISVADDALESRVPANSDEEIERRFWKNIRFEPPMYGADMKGSLFPKKLFHWNVSRLTEQNLLKYLGVDVDGVNSSYLYFGMWKAMFSWHTEDMDLFSINYLHFGESKRWYVIPEHERSKFEQFASSHFPELYKECKFFLRHKTTMISPTILKSANISVYTGIQRENEFIITFPGAYHAGFNHGFNCAESLNFAVESWVPRGLKANICNCKPDNVSINMDAFLHNYKVVTGNNLTINCENNKNDDSSSTTSGDTIRTLPLYNFDYFDIPEEEEEHISIKIPIPGPKKSIKKKKISKKSKKHQTKRLSSPSSSSTTNLQSSSISYNKLKDIPDNQVPNSIIPKSLVKSFTT